MHLLENIVYENAKGLCRRGYILVTCVFAYVFYPHPIRTGGLCLLVFLCFAAMLTAIMTLPLVYDNITEIASLVPNLSVDPAIKQNTRTDFACTRAPGCVTHIYLCTLAEL